MSERPADSVKLPRTTKGKRPTFFADPALDQLMSFILELTTEVAVLRERHDTVERLLSDYGNITHEDIECYRPNDGVEAERASWREAYLERVLRLHHRE